MKTTEEKMDHQQTEGELGTERVERGGINEAPRERRHVPTVTRGEQGITPTCNNQGMAPAEFEELGLV